MLLNRVRREIAKFLRNPDRDPILLNLPGLEVIAARREDLELFDILLAEPLCIETSDKMILIAECTRNPWENRSDEPAWRLITEIPLPHPEVWIDLRVGEGSRKEELGILVSDGGEDRSFAVWSRSRTGSVLEPIVVAEVGRVSGIRFELMSAWRTYMENTDLESAEMEDFMDLLDASVSATAFGARCAVAALSELAARKDLLRDGPVSPDSKRGKGSRRWKESPAEDPVSFDESAFHRAQAMSDRLHDEFHEAARRDLRFDALPDMPLSGIAFGSV